MAAHAADEISGKVAEVKSGDTLVIAADGRDLEIRLADIGAPQGSEYYAPAAQTLLSNIVVHKIVRVVITGRDGPDRAFGRAHAGELDVNLELVRRGAAWMCLEYAATTYLFPYESDAQRHRRGLWAYTWPIDAWTACRRRPPAERPVGKP